MTRVLRSATIKTQSSEDLSSKLGINKKSKSIKRRDKKVKKINNEDKKQSDIWNINSILSSIFAYSDHKDLIKFNTVCKKWNNLTNPIIHRSIKLIRKRAIYYKSNIRGERFRNIDRNVADCIFNNAKHSYLIKEFKYDYEMNPQRAIEFFETFRFICILTIDVCAMSQDQFLGIISPLTQLQELNLDFISIKNNINNRSHNEAVHLSKSLKKLKLGLIQLTGNPELFVQTINSHRNLVEFSSRLPYNNDYLEPFYKHYPSLLSFRFNGSNLQIPQSLLKIFEHNPQLINLKLILKCWNMEIVSCISNYLINLEELKINEYAQYPPDFFANFSQHTKIKKLSLNNIILDNCSLNSILLSCPNLEELNLYVVTFIKPNSIKFRFSNPIMLKKLTINCDFLSEGVFDSILLSFTNINELSIIVSYKSKEAMKSICDKCSNLEKLSISPSNGTDIQMIDTISQSIYESDFFNSSHGCKFTLTHLTLHRFKAHDSKAEYFENFEKLKSIKYTGQSILYADRSNQETVTEIDMNLWSGYRLLTNNRNNYVEFKRNLIN